MLALSSLFQEAKTSYFRLFIDISLDSLDSSKPLTEHMLVDFRRRRTELTGDFMQRRGRAGGFSAVDETCRHLRGFTRSSERWNWAHMALAVAYSFRPLS
jgi:hypothetical protein